MKFLLLITSFITASAQLNCGPAGSFTIAGSSTVEPIARAWAEAYVAKCPSTTITVEGGGSTVGARRVCNLSSAGSAVEIGNMSRDWTPTEVNQTGSPRKFVCNIGTRGRAVTQIDVAIDGITIALINGGLAAQCLRRLDGRGLSIDQLRWIYSNYTKAQLIFSGWDVTSIPFDDNNETSHKWTEISGKTLCPLIDVEIKLSAPGSLSGTFDFFKTVVLPNTTEGVATKRPNGIFQSEIDEELVEFVETSSEERYGDAISFFGFSFFINEGQILYGVPIRNKGASVWVPPNVTTIDDGTYIPFSRRIYMNVLDASLEQTGPYISFGLNQEGIGLVKKVGFVPPPRIELAEILARIGREPPLPIVPTAAPQLPPSIFIPFSPMVPSVIFRPPSKEPTPIFRPPSKAPTPIFRPPTKAPTPIFRPPTKAPTPIFRPPTNAPMPILVQPPLMPFPFVTSPIFPVQPPPVSMTTQAPPRLAPSQVPTKMPTNKPTNVPTKLPTKVPTKLPSKLPTKLPTKVPTKTPTKIPTKTPTKIPTKTPTKFPTKLPTKVPTKPPTKHPTKVPTKPPTKLPTKVPTKVPTKLPSKVPTKRPTRIPTFVPSNERTIVPKQAPTKEPTKEPTREPCGILRLSLFCPFQENFIFCGRIGRFLGLCRSN